MAHDAVGDEVPRAGRDVVERERDAEGLDGNDAKARVVLDGLSFDVSLPGDGRVHGVEEPQVLAKPAPDPHDVDRLLLAGAGFDDELKAEACERPGDLVDDCFVGIADPENPSAVASLGVENPREVALGPVRTRIRWPADDLPYTTDADPTAVSNRDHSLPFADGRLKKKLPRFHVECLQETPSA